MEFKDRLREAMELRGLRQVDMVRLFNEEAKRLGVEKFIKLTRPIISNHLSGYSGATALRVLIYARVLDVDPEWLFGLDK